MAAMQLIGPDATGAAVADVQRRLRELGLDPGHEDGHYGPLTTHAVQVFQRRRHLMAHGAVDEDTWQAIVDASHALGDRLLYVTRPPLRGDDVRELQRGLSRLGFDLGPIDGIHGPETDAGLRDFQHNAGLRVDGIAGPATLRTLTSLRRHHQAATTFEVLGRVDDGHGPGTLTGSRIVVDPSAAHADHPVADGLLGRDVVDDVARRLVGQLTARGAAAILSTIGPDGPDRTVSERAAFANRLDADAVVSIGCTAVRERAAEGISGHHFGDGTVISHRGRALAELCVDESSERTGALNCDVHASTAAILRESRAPAVTIEIGFLSNEAEAARLADPGHRHDLASALAIAVQRWVEEPDTAR